MTGFLRAVVGLGAVLALVAGAAGPATADDADNDAGERNRRCRALEAVIDPDRHHMGSWGHLAVALEAHRRLGCPPEGLANLVLTEERPTAPEIGEVPR